MLILFMVIGNFEIEGNPTLNLIFGKVGFLLYLGVLISYGHYLYSYLPQNVKLNYNLFIINSFLIVAAVLTQNVIYNTSEVNQSSIYAIISIYLLYALLHIIIFPAKGLKSIELGRKARLSEYIGLVFMMIFWPFCIWFVQPRVNRIVGQEKAIL